MLEMDLSPTNLRVAAEKPNRTVSTKYKYLAKPVNLGLTLFTNR